MQPQDNFRKSDSKATPRISRGAPSGKIPRLPSKRSARQKQLLIRMSEAEHQALKAKAAEAGLSMAQFIRDNSARTRVVQNTAHMKSALLLMGRISAHLVTIAERCRAWPEKAVALEIITCLCVIEVELRRWNDTFQTP